MRIVLRLSKPATRLKACWNCWLVAFMAKTDIPTCQHRRKRVSCLSSIGLLAAMQAHVRLYRARSGARLRCTKMLYESSMFMIEQQRGSSQVRVMPSSKIICWTEESSRRSLVATTNGLQDLVSSRMGRIMCAPKRWGLTVCKVTICKVMKGSIRRLVDMASGRSNCSWKKHNRMLTAGDGSLGPWEVTIFLTSTARGSGRAWRKEEG